MNRIVFIIIKEGEILWYFVSIEENEKANMNVFKDAVVLQKKTIETPKSVSDFRKPVSDLFGKVFNAVQHGFFGDPNKAKNGITRFFNLIRPEKEVEPAIAD